MTDQPGSSKPVGKCRATGMQMRKPANEKAIYVNVLCEDENGTPYYYTSAAFCFELKPGYPPEDERAKEGNTAAAPTCSCVYSDAWRCAVAKDLTTVSCGCKCHRASKRAEVR